MCGGCAGVRSKLKHNENSKFSLDLPSLWGHTSHVEKRRPTYDLEFIKRAIGTVETLAITTSAMRDAVSLGFDRGGIVETILSIEPRMFYKSMTTFADRRVWQDVYHARARGLTLYVKFQADVVTTFTVMAFKEK